MSCRIGRDILALRPTSRVGHALYCSHDPLRKHIQEEMGLRLEDAWECDLIWNVNDGEISWSARGRVTDMGHAEFLEGGVDRRPAQPCPFRNMHEALCFDAESEYGLPDFEGLIQFYRDAYAQGQREYPEQVYTGGYYKTLFSGAIETFGWDMLLQAAADQGSFERILDSYFRLTLHHVRAWAETDIEAFILHDDMVWTEGPFIHPDFYRRAVFPRYAALIKPLQARGKKVLFCSDGNWACFLDDIAGAGFDGFIFEPLIPFSMVAERYGHTHVLVGSCVDCRTLTFDGPEAIRREIDETLRWGQECPGFIFAVGNHIPANVPVENALFYFDHLRKHWQRHT